VVICAKTNKRIVGLHRRLSESILVRVGVTALSSIAVAAAAALRVIEWNLYGTGIIWLSKATVRTLAVATFSQPHHSEDDNTDDKKGDNDHPNDDGTQDASPLTDMSDGRGLKRGREVNALS